MEGKLSIEYFGYIDIEQALAKWDSERASNRVVLLREDDNIIGQCWETEDAGK